MVLTTKKYITVLTTDTKLTFHQIYFLILVSVEDSSKNELMSIKVDAKYVLEKLKVRSL